MSTRARRVRREGALGRARSPRLPPGGGASKEAGCAGSGWEEGRGRSARDRGRKGRAGPAARRAGGRPVPVLGHDPGDGRKAAPRREEGKWARTGGGGAVPRGRAGRALRGRAREAEGLEGTAGALGSRRQAVLRRTGGGGASRSGRGALGGGAVSPSGRGGRGPRRVGEVGVGCRDDLLRGRGRGASGRRRRGVGGSTGARRRRREGSRCGRPRNRRTRPEWPVRG